MACARRSFPRHISAHPLALHSILASSSAYRASAPSPLMPCFISILMCYLFLIIWFLDIISPEPTPPFESHVLLQCVSPGIYDASPLAPLNHRLQPATSARFIPLQAPLLSSNISVINIISQRFLQTSLSTSPYESLTRLHLFLDVIVSSCPLSRPSLHPLSTIFPLSNFTYPPTRPQISPQNGSRLYPPLLGCTSGGDKSSPRLHSSHSLLSRLSLLPHPSSYFLPSSPLLL